ncbi:hypothetical protein NDU88_001084 [Pleurodeles waltl]|uniref:Uncharacterized protein n=1 Tax=Pleurodeles waltl TaxID=8319 RepID=A0AAV7N9Y5_PLEWA|nr:hypothetical protein NDU88_001084 [Pleurodeles waltl]
MQGSHHGQQRAQLSLRSLPLCSPTASRLPPQPHHELSSKPRDHERLGGSAPQLWAPPRSGLKGCPGPILSCILLIHSSEKRMTTLRGGVVMPPADIWGQLLDIRQDDAG